MRAHSNFESVRVIKWLLRLTIGSVGISGRLGNYLQQRSPAFQALPRSTYNLLTNFENCCDNLLEEFWLSQIAESSKTGVSL